MKKQFITLSIILLSTTIVQAQDAITRFFKHYEGREHITDINLSGSLFRLMTDASAQKAEDDFMRLAANIESVRIMVDAEDKNALTTMREASAKLSGAYETMMTIREKDNNIEMFIAEQGGTVSEMVMAIGSGDKFVIMSIRGKFKLDDVSQVSGTVARSVQGDLFSGTKVEKADFKVWPNPATSSEKITLAIPNDMLGAKLMVMDSNGRTVHSENVNQIDKSLNLSSLRPGAYVLKMSKGAVEINKKLILN